MENKNLISMWSYSGVSVIESLLSRNFDSKTTALLLGFLERCSNRISSAPELFKHNAHCVFDEFLFYLGATAVRQIRAQDINNFMEVASSIPKDTFGEKIINKINELDISKLRQAAFETGKVQFCIPTTAEPSDPIDIPMSGYLDSAVVIPLHGESNNSTSFIEIFFAVKFLCQHGNKEFIGASLLCDINALEPLAHTIELISSIFVHAFISPTPSVQISSEEAKKHLPTEARLFGSVLESKKRFFETASGYTVDKYIYAYEEYFKPMDAFFSKLEEQIRNLAFDGGNPPQVSFLYSGKDDMAVSFFLTSKTLRSILRGKSVMRFDLNLRKEEIKELMLFEYKPGYALNGSVLSGRCSLDVRNYATDSRQTQLDSNATGLAPQIERVRKLFEFDNNKHTFMLPVVASANGNRNANIFSIVILTMQRPFNAMDKLKALDIVWRYSPAIEATMLAQQATEIRIRAELESLTKMGHYAGLLAHEIRPALSEAVAMSSAMLSLGSIDQKTQNDFCRLRSQAKRGQDAINRFLAMTRKGQPASSLFKDHDLNVDIRAIAGELEQSAIWTTTSIQRLPITIETNTLAAVVVKVKLDPSYFSTAIRNLLINARDAIVSRYDDNRDNLEPPPQIKVRLDVKEGKAIIDIEDNGIGIEEKDIAHIFDEAFSTKSTHKKLLGGLGIGLPTAKRIIEEHGGALSFLKTQLGVGTTFRIELPLIN